MNNLEILIAENGFIIFDRENPGMAGKQWAFESAHSLANFIKQWGEDIHKTLPIDAQLPVLEKGKALIITGAKGAGKITLAHKIAEATGSRTFTTLQKITQSKFELDNILKHEPDTVIIEDELNHINIHLNFIKSLISNDKIKIDRKGMVPKGVKTPHFIICTGDKEPLKHALSECRFTVLPIDKFQWSK